MSLIKEGDCIAVYTPGGGGYGNPVDRPSEQVLADVADGYYTIEHARDIYGVVISDKMVIDVAATKLCREALQPT